MVSEVIRKELEYIVKLHKQYGAPRPCETVDELIEYILACVADGSRRPGAWERQMLDMLGIVADCEEHSIYRSDYGEPIRNK